jgi:hypothetical protein
MSQSREERLARNEASFRSLNEAIATKVHARRPESDAELAGFLCECANVDCEDLVHMDMEHYEKVRQDACLFLLRPGHEIPDVEDVVERADGVLIVRKHDDVTDIVHETNPRE